MQNRKSTKPRFSPRVTLRLPISARTASCLAGIVLICGSTVGCSSPTPDETASVGEAGENQAQTSDTMTSQSPAVGSSKSHHHVAGPNGGKLVHLSPSAVHAEWKYDSEAGRLLVYLDDFDADRIEGAKIVLTSNSTPQTLDLSPSDQAWSTEEPALQPLLGNPTEADAGTVELVVTDDEGEHTCVLWTKGE